MATLFDIYKSKGQQLPELGDRFNDTAFKDAAAKAGIDPGAYVGSDEQNNTISKYLIPSTITTSSGPRQELVKNSDAFYEAVTPKAKTRTDTLSDQIKSAQGEIDTELDTFVTALDSIGERSSTATQNLLRGIVGDYASRRAEQSDKNSRYVRGLHLLGLQGGEAQATPGLHIGTLRSAEIAGHRELERIDAQERKLIAEAEQAQIDNDFKLFNEKMNAYKEARREKNQVINDLYSQALDRRRLEQADIDLVSSYAEGLYSEYAKLGEQDRAAFVQEVADQLGVSTMSVIAAMGEEAYGRSSKSSSTAFSKTDQLKLEQAGLLNASRKEQLDFLYGDKSTNKIDQLFGDDNSVYIDLSSIKTLKDYNDAITTVIESDMSSEERKKILNDLIQLQKSKKLK